MGSPNNFQSQQRSSTANSSSPQPAAATRSTHDSTAKSKSRVSEKQPRKGRTAKTCPTIRLTNLDPSNEPMWRIAEEVSIFYTKTLNDTARQTLNVNNSLLTSSMPTLTLQCVHDCVCDPFTKETIAPHFIADCDDLCNYLADVVAKDKFGDSEPQLYMVLAAIAKKDFQRTRIVVKKASKSAARAEKKLKRVSQQTGESGTPAVVEAKEALTEANNALNTAESAFKQAGQKLKDATERADESIKIRSLVIKCWSTPLGELVKAASHSRPDCVERCHLILPPGSKVKGQHQCKKLQLLVCLTPDAFNQARAAFGIAYHVGRSMPRELPKSWGYLQYGWNTCARTPVASAIESITGGDDGSVTFHLFGDGKKKTPK